MTSSMLSCRDPSSRHCLQLITVTSACRQCNRRHSPGGGRMVACRQRNLSHCTYPVVTSLASRQQKESCAYLTSAQLACSCPYLMKCHFGMQTARRPSLLLECKVLERLSAAGAAPLQPSCSATAEWTMRSMACTVSASATPGWWVSHSHDSPVTNF